MITAQQMLDAVTTHSLQLIRDPKSLLWMARSMDRGRLHQGGFATPQEAVEAATTALLQSAAREEDNRVTRMFELLADGLVFTRSRLVARPDPDGGPPVQVRIWDVFDTGTNTRLVAGESSLSAALVEWRRLQP